MTCFGRASEAFGLKGFQFAIRGVPCAPRVDRAAPVAIMLGAQLKNKAPWTPYSTQYSQGAQKPRRIGKGDGGMARAVAKRAPRRRVPAKGNPTVENVMMKP